MENSFEEVAVVFGGRWRERGEQVFSASSMQSLPLIFRAAEAWEELIETHKPQPPATLLRKCLHGRLMIRPKKG